MKLINLSILVFSLSASFILSSCNKQLNVLPSSSEVDGNIITDMKSAKTALNGVYYRFADAGEDRNGTPTTQWYNEFEGLPSELGGLVLFTSGNQFSDLTLNPSTYRVDAIWNYGYNLVNAANGFLRNINPISAIPADKKKQMVAEAKFLRAYANSSLLLYYGQYHDLSSKYGIILRNEFVTSGDINLPRNSVAESYTSILADIDDAIADLPGENSQISYANVWAAKLLKARLLINRGSMDDYATVISLTKDIITNSPFSLEANVKDIFLNKGFNSNEVIMGVQPFPTQIEVFKNFLYYGQQIATDSMISLFKNDPRSQWVYQTVTDRYGDLQPLITKNYPGDASAPAPTPINENGYAFRLTEAYLLQAEALTTSGGDLDMAKSLLKTIMGHAGITDFSVVNAETSRPGLQLLIVKEEMKNFVVESGQDWLALRRLPFSTLQILVPAIKNESQLLLPIPQSEITRNGKLAGQQNPGY